MALDGWTKVGDRIPETGYWVMYRHKGTLNAEVEVALKLPPEAGKRAEKLFETRRRAVRRGGFWLVDPTGRVCAVTFVRAGD